MPKRAQEGAYSQHPITQKMISFECLSVVNQSSYGIQNAPTQFGYLLNERSQQKPKQIEILAQRDDPKQEIIQYECLALLSQSMRGQQSHPVTYGSCIEEAIEERPRELRVVQKIDQYECLSMLSQQQFGKMDNPTLYATAQIEMRVPRLQKQAEFSSIEGEKLFEEET